MDTNGLMKYDLHCHTSFSACAARDADIEGYIACALEDGLCAVGFTDHAWDNGIGIPSSWYAPQTYERLLTRSVPDTHGIRVFMGAEGEYAMGLLAASRKAMKSLDYVIIPHSHTHMRGLVLPEGINDAHSHGRYLFASAVSLLHHPDIDCVFGIAHPFAPCGKKFDEVEEILSAVTDEEFAYIGSLAAKRGVFLELNASCMKDVPPEKAESCGYARFFRMAKKAGASFFTGSDNHSPRSGKDNPFNLLPDYAEAFGLVPDDFKDALSRILTL